MIVSAADSVLLISDMRAMLHQTLEKTGMNRTRQYNISHYFMVGVLCSTEIKADNSYYYTSDSL